MYHPNSQIDSPEERDRRSLESAIFTPEDAESPTRQELKDDADINVMIKRFGGIPDTGRRIQFGEQMSFDLDLMTAFEALANAKSSFDDLPAELRAKYPTITRLMEAVERGEVSLGMPDPGSEPPAGTQGAQDPAPAGAPPSNPPA